MKKNNKISIIGVLDNGVEGLTPEVHTLILQADVVFGGVRTLALFEKQFTPYTQQVDLIANFGKMPQLIKDALNDHLKVVVLATGDPLCHGVARYLINKLSAEICEVYPNVSTIQLAFARFGLAWQGVSICSVHTKDAGEWTTQAGPEHGLYPLVESVRNNQLIALFTSPENTPDRIARMLSQLGLADAYSMSVAEGLATETENIIPDLSISQAAEREFSHPNVVILQRLKSSKIDFNPILLGLADETFSQRKPDKGLITKREVRAVSLARMQLRSDSIVWDIGAGSGSVGLEAARICNKGFVFAIEKNELDYSIAKQNQLQMAVTNYRVEHGKAPELLDTWPDPNAVFFGGSGGELSDLIKLCLARLKPAGQLVMNFVTLENMSLATQVLKELNADWDVLQLQASRSKPILHMHRLQAENPVWVVCVQKLEGQAL